MPQIIQVRRGTAAQWTAANTVLAPGEIGFETDTYRQKIGNGATAWAGLAYVSNVQAGAIVASTTQAPNATAVQAALSGYAASGHGHAIAGVSGLQTLLDSLQAQITALGTGGTGGGTVTADAMYLDAELLALDAETLALI